MVQTQALSLETLVVIREPVIQRLTSFKCLHELDKPVGF